MARIDIENRKDPIRRMDGRSPLVFPLGHPVSAIFPLDRDRQTVTVDVG